MSNQPTIVLAPFDGALAAELAAHSGLRSCPLETAGNVPGALWIFVDWLLPDGSGIELCRRLRADPATMDARLFLVLEDDDRESRRRALKAGADDYLLGPLSAQAIRARLLDASPTTSRLETILTHGLLKLDREAHQVRAGGSPVPMSPNEFRLLAFFMENRDRVMSRSQLIGALKDGGAVDERTVDVWIGRLRRALVAAKIPDPIRTVRQLGYVYDSY